MKTKKAAHNKTKMQEKSRPAKTPNLPALERTLEQEVIASNGVLKSLPDHATTAHLRQTAVLQMQQREGNAITRQFLNLSGTGQGHGLGLQLQGEEEAVPTPDTPLSTEGLGIEPQELPGHGERGRQAVVQRQGGGPPAPAAAAGPTANINLTVNAPQIVRLPEATISANHGRPNVAGWCTPSYNVQPIARTPNSISLTVTLDFRIELASEYTGGRLAVLQDHEQGHVIIGERVARQHFVNGMRTALQALPNFNSIPPIQTALQTAANNFVRDEGAQSQAYDNSDYPRMREAYLGVQTPLADLAAASAQVQAMVDATEAFIGHASTINTSEPENTELLRLAEQVRQARTALSEQDLARLQYNPEFKYLISACQNLASTLVDSVAEEERPYMEELIFVLNSFTWQAAP
jgi:hypothetical protein